jgi:hypothetical protein
MDFNISGGWVMSDNTTSRNNALDDVTIVWMIVPRGRFEPGRVVCRIFFDVFCEENADWDRDHA